MEPRRAMSSVSTCSPSSKGSSSSSKVFFGVNECTAEALDVGSFAQLVSWAVLDRPFFFSFSDNVKQLIDVVKRPFT